MRGLPQLESMVWRAGFDDAPAPAKRLISAMIHGDLRRLRVISIVADDPFNLRELEPALRLLVCFVDYFGSTHHPFLVAFRTSTPTRVPRWSVSRPRP